MSKKMNDDMFFKGTPYSLPIPKKMGKYVNLYKDKKIIVVTKKLIGYIIEIFEVKNKDKSYIFKFFLRKNSMIDFINNL